MTTHLTTRKENKIELNGNLMTGDTFAIKDYIKNYLEGKWNKDVKGWIINLSKLDNVLNTSNSIGLRIDDTPVAIHKNTQTSNGYCHKCHTYCYGDCEA